MNIYRTEFFAFCPANGVRVKYELTIETTETIMVEQIVDEVTLHSKGYHEQIADDLFRSFGGRQTLRAHHHGVDIETRRPMTACVTCAGSGLVDRTGQGDLQACACRTAGVKVRPQECAASGAGHSDGPHGPHGETQCTYCGQAPAPSPEHNCNTCAHRDFGGLSEPCVGCSILWPAKQGLEDRWAPPGVAEARHQTFSQEPPMGDENHG